MGGGGQSGGGGGGSGAVSYPAYMQLIHGLMLDGGGTDTPNSSVVDCINTALGANPFTGLVAYDPDTALAAMLTAISDVQSLVTALSYHTDFDAMAAAAVAEIDAVVTPATYITDKATAFSAGLDADLAAKTYPRFEAGMRNINAVMTSAFVIGRALIEADKVEQVAKFTADMYYQVDRERAQMIISSIGEMSRMLTQKIEFQRAIAALTIEAERLTIADKSEEEHVNREIDTLAAKWPLEVWQYGSNVLAAIGGGTSHTGTPGGTGGQSQLKSALVGGLSGAAAGAMIGAQIGAIGGPVGAAAGAAIGIASAFL